MNTWKTASSSSFQSTFPLTLLHPRKNSCCFRSYEAKVDGSGAELTGLRGSQSQGFSGGNDSVTPPAMFLTPLMMCWGGILTTTRRVTSSFGPQVLMPSMGDRSGGGEQECWFGGAHQTTLHLPATPLSIKSLSTPKEVPGAQAQTVIRVLGPPRSSVSQDSGVGLQQHWYPGSRTRVI